MLNLYRFKSLVLVALAVAASVSGGGYFDDTMWWH